MAPSATSARRMSKRRYGSRVRHRLRARRCGRLPSRSQPSEPDATMTPPPTRRRWRRHVRRTGRRARPAQPPLGGRAQRRRASLASGYLARPADAPWSWSCPDRESRILEEVRDGGPREEPQVRAVEEPGLRVVETPLEEREPNGPVGDVRDRGDDEAIFGEDRLHSSKDTRGVRQVLEHSPKTTTSNDPAPNSARSRACWRRLRRRGRGVAPPQRRHRDPSLLRRRTCSPSSGMRRGRPSNNRRRVRAGRRRRTGLSGLGCLCRCDRR